MNAKSSTILIWLVACALILSACSTRRVLERRFLGKRFPTTQLKVLLDQGHHDWRHEHVDISYDYTVDHVAGTIFFKGTARYNKSIDESELRSEMILQNVKRCEFRLLFADDSATIVAVRTFNVYPDSNIFEPFPLEAVLAMPKSGSLIHFSYYLYSQGS